jgi:hypothetical protein
MIDINTEQKMINKHLAIKQKVFRKFPISKIKRLP